MPHSPPIRTKDLAVLLITLTLTGCASTNAVGDGAFKKRRLRPGWHVDIGKRPSEMADARTVREPEVPFLREVPVDLHVELRATIAGSPIVLEHNEQITHSTSRTEVATVPVPVLSAFDELVTIEEPLTRWNPWAVPAFTSALGTVAYGILGTSNLILVLAVALTLILATIAVKRGRMNEWSGKGFAISALIIGYLAALITLIALIGSG